MKKTLSIILTVTMLLSILSVAPFTVSAEGTEVDQTKCLNLDAHGTRWPNSDSLIVEIYITDIDGNNLVKTECVKTGDMLWSFDPESNGFTIEDGKQYRVSFGAEKWTEVEPDEYNLQPYTGTAELLFDTVCLGDIAYFTGDYINNDFGGSVMKIAWKNSILGSIKYINDKGEVVGETIPNNATPYEFFVDALKNGKSWQWRDNSGKTGQQLWDDIAAALGLSADDVERAIEESGKSIEWNKNYSSILGNTPGTGCLNIDVSEWFTEQKDRVAITISARKDALGNDTTILANESLCVKTGDNLWSYDPSYNGVTLEEGQQYRLTVSQSGTLNSGSAVLLFDTSCLGDTAYFTGKLLEASFSSGYAHQEMAWRNSSLGSEKYIDYKGDVVGETIPNNATPYQFFVDALKRNNSWTWRNSSGKSEQRVWDDIATALGLSADDVEKAIEESGNSDNIHWHKNYSSIPGTEPGLAACLSLDVSESGWADIKDLDVWIYEVGSGAQAVWVDCTETGENIWSFDPGLKDFTPEEGKQYRIYYWCYIDRTYYYTADLLFDSSCLGDTAYFTGNTYDRSYSGKENAQELAWRNSSLGSMKFVNSKGEVLGETIPNNATPYEFLVSYLKNSWNNDSDKTDQKFLDDIGIALGLSAEEVESALTEADRASNYAWFKYFSRISGGPEDYSDLDVIYVDSSAAAEKVKDIKKLYVSVMGGQSFYAPLIKIGDNKWVFSLDHKVYNRKIDSSTSYRYPYIITPAISTLYIYGSADNVSFQTYYCKADKSCCGDTLIVDSETVTPSATVNLNYNDNYFEHNLLHWKNSDSGIYGTVSGFDSEYELIEGTAKTSFSERVSLLRIYVNKILPKIRNTTIEPDWYLIDSMAKQLGLKKADLELLFLNSELWDPEDSELEDGFSYDEGVLYLKKTDESVPLGYCGFTLDAPTDYYAMYNSRPEIISASSSSSSSSSGYAGGQPEYIPIPKYEVVRCDGNGKFTTVSREPITAVDGYFFFFRPGENYCFGYNTSSELSENGSSSSSGSSSWASSEYPLSTPVFKSVTVTKDGLLFSWNEVNGAEKYRLEMKGDSDWVPVVDTTGTSYLYKAAKSGCAYTFSVSCVSPDGKKYLSRAHANSRSIRYIAAPEITVLQGMKEGNLISWDSVGGNARYRVFVKSRNTWKALGDTYECSFLHSSTLEGSIAAQVGVEYTYTVACVSFNGKSILSDYKDKDWTMVYSGEETDPVPMEQTMIGDLTGDGKVDITDATVIQKAVAELIELTDEQKKAADTNGDGKVDITDATMIQKFVAELIDHLGK